ncbi:MAG: Cna B-type domain-containing protein [Lachnospiraceae bacterium]|nr:Cna B-type domain-containing protein [Lachnospiraceae bacterium]
MKKRWRSIVSVFLAFAMVVLCLPEYVSPVKTAKADEGGPDVKYVDETGETKTLTGAQYEIIEALGTTERPGHLNMPTTWGEAGKKTYYVVGVNQRSRNNDKRVTYGTSSRITVAGDVVLILPDITGDSRYTYGINLQSGINVPDGASLTIYGGPNGGCSLTASGNQYNAGIGGNRNYINAETCGTIRIYGGTITATGGSDAAGIGDGSSGRGGTVIIGGGKVTANGGRYGAGIGGGNYGNGGSITITGGTVTAQGGSQGAGIGGGYHGYGGNIIIDGGSVTATGGNNGAGIGGGYSEGNTTDTTQKIIIKKGSVTATGGKGAAGIGSGYYQTHCGTISISGGSVTATAGTYGSRSGSNWMGYTYYDCPAAIGGSFVSGDSITISGGTVNATARYNGTAIGAVQEEGGANVTITGGAITATANDGVGIGNGYGYESHSSTTVNVSISITDASAFVQASSYRGGVNLVTAVKDVTSNPNRDIAAGRVTYLNTINGKKLVKGTTFTIKFVNDDADHTILQTSEVAPGAVPSYNGTPTKSATAEYTFTFTGWKDEADRFYSAGATLPEATASMTYTAQYSSVVNKYTVKFVGENGTPVLLDTKEYDYGTPVANILKPEDPTKRSTDEYDFEFAGWSPQLSEVTENVVYQATFRAVKRKYTIKFVGEGGSELYSNTFEYGTNPTFSGEEPTKEATAQYTYTFFGWQAENGSQYSKTSLLPEVNGDATYTVVFTNTTNEYTICFVNFDGAELQTPTVAFGQRPSYTGSTPVHPKTQENSFTFIGWEDSNGNFYAKDADLPEVNGAMTYTAFYSSTKNQYTVKFVKDDANETVISSKVYEYGTPVSDIEVPEGPFKDADADWVYAFNGWNPTISEVTGDVVYKAQYTTSAREYINVNVAIFWNDNDDQDGVRPESVVIELIAGEETLKSATLSENNSWGVFWNLPKNDVKGNPIEYTASHGSISDYTTSVEMNGESDYFITITDYHAPKTTSLTVKKAWFDFDNLYRTRPDKLVVYLNDGSGTVETVTLKAESGWTATVDGLPVYKSHGVAIQYYWREENVEGYSQTGIAVGRGVTTIANELETTTVSGTVTWKMNGYSENLIPNQVTIKVWSGDDVVDTITATGEGASWTFTSNELPKYQSNGEYAEYRIGLESVPGGFSSSVIYPDITFTYKPVMTTVAGEVVWNLKGNSVDLIPDSTSVSVYDDTTVVDVLDVTADEDGNWTFESKELPKYREDGTTEIVYTLDTTVAGFETTINGTGITNTLITVKISGEKIWDMQGYDESLMPTEITVYVRSGNETVDTITLTADDDGEWKFESRDLPRYESDGKTEITYTVDEEVPAGFDKDVNGTLITNTYIPEVVTVSGTVSWDVKGNESLIPESVLVYIMDGEDVADAFDVTMEDSWTFTSRELPKYRADGKTEIRYTVEEVYVDGFTTEINGTQIMNTLETVDVTVSVEWDDADDQDGYRPDDITVWLMDGNDAQADVTLSAPDWTYTWENLPKKVSGREIQYVPKMPEVDQYQLETVEGGFKYVHTPEITTVTVVVDWDDANNQDGYRPEKVGVNLLKDGQVIETVEVRGNDWTYTWTELAKKAQGEVIDYTVSTGTIEEYDTLITKAQDGSFNYTLTNTHAIEKVKVTISLEWDDAEDQDGYRPDKVDLILMRDEEEVKPIELNAANGWKDTVANLDRKHEGVEYDYALSFITDVSNYYNLELAEPIVDKETGDVQINIKYIHEVEKVDVAVSIAWDDENNQDGYRPNEVDVKLYIGDTDTGLSYKLNPENGWTYTWKNLDKKDAGSDLAYTVKVDLNEDYEITTTKAEGSFTYTLKYTHKPEETNAGVTVVWDDTDDQDGYRPESLTVTLLADGEDAGKSIELGPNNWTYTWNGLAKKAGGSDIVYTVSVGQIDEYTTATKKAEGGFDYTITNSHTTEKTDVSVTIIWDDNEDQDGCRPDMVTVNVLVGSSLVKSCELNADDSWSYTWKDLDKKANGLNIEYKVTEDSFSGYTIDISKADNSFAYTVKNIHETEKTSATIEVAWNVDAKQDKTLPESITAVLSDGKEVTLSAATNWKATVENLPKYKDHGQTITYSWSLNEVPSGFYQSELTTGTTTAKTLTYRVNQVELALHAQAIIANRYWLDTDFFEFTLEADPCNQEGAVLPSQTVGTVDRNSSTWNYEEIVFTAYGTYKFTITETKGNIPGIEYDIVPRKITVIVRDDGLGSLYIEPYEVTDGGYVSVTNEYHSDSDEIVIAVKTELIGEKLADKQFSFELLDEGKNVIQTTTCEEDGTVKFAPIYYSEDDMVQEDSILEERTFRYYIREVSPEDTTGVIYDAGEYSIDITVEDNQEGSILVDPDALNPDITFTNIVVKVQKVDEDGEGLKGAHLRVVDKEGTVIDEWVSETEAYIVKGLQIDEVYTLSETMVPEGRKFVKDVAFSVDESGKVTIGGTGVSVDVTTLLLTNEKCTEPVSELKVKDVNDTTGVESGWQVSADYDIGDEVKFKATAKLADNVTDYTSYKVIFHVEMDKGLTFNNQIEKVTVNCQALNVSEYTLTSAEHSFDLAIIWNGVNNEKISDEELNLATVEVFYAAKLEDDAIAGAKGNGSFFSLDYSCNPNLTEDGKPIEEYARTEKSSVSVFTYDFELKALCEDGKALEGAEFKLEKVESGNTVLIGNVVVNGESECVFHGIDDGEYVLTSVSLPEGTAEVDPFVFVVSAEHAVTDDGEADTMLKSLSGETVVGEMEFSTDNSLSTLTGTINLELKTFTITFLDDENLPIAEKKYKYGTKAENIETPKTVPEKKSTPKYSYYFSGWTPKIADVTGDAEYTVEYESILNEYEIVFFAEDGKSVLAKTFYEYGTEAKDMAVPEAPKKESTAASDFAFVGWKNGDKIYKATEIPMVEGDAVYTAVYSDTTRSYKVTFTDENGKVLSEKEYPYGTEVAKIAVPEAPAKAENADYTYTFKAWTPEISKVEYNVTYKATYEAVAKPKEDPKPTRGIYQYIKEGDGSYTKGSGKILALRFKRTENDEITFDKFVRITFNGKALDASAFGKKRGSVIIELKPEYLDTLAEGTSEFTVEFEDGDPVTVAVSILPAKSNETEQPDSPKTADLMPEVLFLFTSFLIFIGAVMYTRRKREEEA